MRAIVACVVVLACVVVGLDAFAGPFFSLAVRELPAAVQGQRVIGGVEGPVKSTDEHAHIVRVASGFLGLSSLPIVVTPETTIAVDGKLGWWGDLQRGLLVRVIYEVTPDERLVASRVEVLDQTSASIATIPSMSDRAAESPVPPLARPVEPATPHVVRRESDAIRPDAITPAPVRASPQPPAVSLPKPPVSVSTTATPSTAPWPAPATTPPPAPARRPATAEPAPGEDGGAAVEWLFKESTPGR